MEAPKYPSVDECIKKQWDINTMEYYLGIKRNKIVHFVTAWTELENMMLNEMAVKESLIPYYFTHTWDLSKTGQIHREGAGWQLWVGGSGDGGIEQKGTRTQGHGQERY